MHDLPFPTVEEYQAELQPFIDAGWEMRFSRPRGGFTCLLHGHHRRLGVHFSMHVDQECRQQPELMRDCLRQAWAETKRDMEKKYGFPKMRIYGAGWTHEPSDWQTFSALVGRSPEPVDSLVKDLETAAFRRQHGIVLASPFKDITGELVYELEVVNVPWGKLIMFFDEMAGGWTMLSVEKHIPYSPSAAANGVRVGRVGKAFSGVNSIQPFNGVNSIQPL